MQPAALIRRGKLDLEMQRRKKLAEQTCESQPGSALCGGPLSPEYIGPPVDEWLPDELKNMTMTWLNKKGRLAKGSDWLRPQAGGAAPEVAAASSDFRFLYLVLTRPSALSMPMLYSWQPLHTLAAPCSHG
jgi:hypothetical protein